MPIKNLFCAAVTALALACLALRPTVADEPASKPAESEPDLQWARERTAKLSHREQGIHLLLLRLVKPRFGAELGRTPEAGALRPLEDPAGGQLSTVELLRLWAVLETGLGARRELDSELRRLIDQPYPSGEPSLALVGAEMMVIRAALRANLGRRADLEQRARSLFEISEKATRATSTSSPFATQTALQPQWFANHLWRGMIARCAVELKLTEKARLWERDLDLLCNAFVPKAGFTSSRAQPRDLSRDLHCNLFAWATLQMALSVPDKMLGKNVSGEVARTFKSAPEVLRRLNDEYNREAFMQAHLAFCMMLVRSTSPSKIDRWLDQLLHNAANMAGLYCPSASVMRISADLGFDDLQVGAAPVESVEAANLSLFLIGLCGGMWHNDPAPLAGKSVEEVGQTLFALASLGASDSLRAGIEIGNDRQLDEAIAKAIESGCRCLANLQDESGAFPGDNDRFLGRHGLCILTLLHGGYERTHPAIKRGMAYLSGKGFTIGSKSYEGGIMLMMLQKYFEPEAIKAGIYSARTPHEYHSARETLWGMLPHDYRDVIRKLVVDVNSARRDGKGWGYAMGSGLDNSNSQYAMLGYKAACLLGAGVPTSLFTEEAERLISQLESATDYSPQPRSLRYGIEKKEPQKADGDKAKDGGAKSTAAAPARQTPGATTANTDVEPGGWAYTCVKGGYNLQMTAAGVSSLMVCLDELKMRQSLPESLERNICGGIERGLALIGVMGFGDKPTPSGEFVRRYQGQLMRYNMYNAYSVERACVMAGVRLLCGEYDWFRTLAWGLIETQKANGSWNDSVTNTCWAVLCLRRASMPVVSEPRPVITQSPTPRDEEPKPEPKKPVITEGPKSQQPKAETPKPGEPAK